MAIFIFFQYNESKKIFKEISIPEIVFPVQVTIFGVSINTLSGQFTFFSQNQRQIGQLERSWNGNKLFFDFYFIRFGDKILYFPYRLYTEKTNQKSMHLGTIVTKYYQSHKTNNLYFFDQQTKKEQANFTKLFYFTRMMVHLRIPKENIGIKTLDLSVLESNTLYIIKIVGENITLVSEKDYFL
ncbi:MAG: hypothetical protein ACRC5H_06660 [Treponemataceae bacterium]